MSRPLPAVPCLECGGVVLRPAVPADAEAMAAASHDELLRRHSGVAPFSAEASHEWIAADPARRAAGESVGAVIADTDTDALLGHLGFHRIAWFDRRAELGFWLAPSARGRGAGRAAVGGFLDWAVPVCDIARVDAFSDVDNLRAHAVLEAAGFVREGELASYGQRDDGSRVAAYAFGLVVEG